MRGSAGVIRAVTGEGESRGRTYGAPAFARLWERWDALRPEACDGRWESALRGLARREPEPCAELSPTRGVR
eukprot:2996026-Alexandrium_andersonii.AAC.1